jgi:hypothetical protein
MPSHYAGLVVTDMTIATCSNINVFSSCDLDPTKWQRIPKDLYLGRAWTTTSYLHVSRKREEDLTEDDSVVIDVSVGGMNPGLQRGTKDKNPTDQWEARPGGLWIKRSAKKKASDSIDAVTDVDILFGDDAAEAREYWAIMGTPLVPSRGSSQLSAHLTVRRGGRHPMKKPKPRIRDDGKFKIMQLADLHLSTGVGICRHAIPDTYNGGPCEADPRTLDFVSKILDEEKPDFVVLSGDQVNGDTAPDATSVCFQTIFILHPVPNYCTGHSQICSFAR